jgi:predicted AlkP superfamily phosphohydrolase/phosphomutase
MSKARALCFLLVLAVTVADLHTSHPQMQFAYVGPGAGFAFLGSFLAIVLSVIACLLSVLVWPFRVLWLFVSRRGRFGKTRIKKAIFLGLDGLDPKLTERWMAEGKLPNLSRLREQGAYSRLRTTLPALSPVAWSTFATGVNPAKHNIFDFLNRDLRNYAPELSSAKVRPSKGLFSRATVELRRKSEPFWKILSRNAISSTILRIPITFPPDRFRGRLLSAMSTPDLQGTQGTFSWFSSQSDLSACQGGLRLPLHQQTNGDWQGDLSGPDGATAPFQILGSTGNRRLQIQNKTCNLRLGEYTPWIRLKFPVTLFSSAHGIVRFLLTAEIPHLSLYVTPVEIDPENPALPISHPSYYATYLAKLLGSFATLGMAEDTWALNEGAIDEDAFLKQAQSIQAEREAMLFSALDRTRRGVVACVFDTTDRVQHMFFRHFDLVGSKHANVIEDLYRDMDRIVGKTLKYVEDGTALFVLSDHGFCSFRRGVNLNSWLHQNGYLKLAPGRSESGEYFDGIDWSNTRAYTFGLGGLYLNIKGREAQGIVTREQAISLKSELIARLTGLRDEESGKPAIQAVYDAELVYKGPYSDSAPDLLPGYSDGFRASWSAAVGRVTDSVFEENHKCWSGDHCVDPAIVPGVLFTNQKISDYHTDPGIEDLAPTVLDLFGITPPRWMEGRALIPDHP